MADKDVWAIAFTSKKRDPDGVLQARAAEITSILDGKVKVGCFDIKAAGAKEIAGEVGVRTHNLPAIRVFLSRARSASKVEVKGDGNDLRPAQAMADDVLKLCADNKPAEGGSALQKITLALGGGGGDEL